jgi:hypothetical protein
MGITEFTQQDLRELDNEIKFLTPRYQKLVVALISGYLEAIRPELDGVDFRLEIKDDDETALLSLDTIFNSAFTQGARPGIARNDFGKVGDHFAIDLTQYDR